MNLVDAALAFHDYGCCVVPVRADGTKTPVGAWKHRQTQRPTRDEVAALGAYTAIGLICGTVSGNLEMLELEGRAVTEGLPQQLAKLMADHGQLDLWNRLNTGYLEFTPTGGLHWLYRVDGTPRGNLKLARRPATPDELADNPDDRIKVLAETRGQGGFVVVAPSHGTAHPTGKPWTLLAGGPATIPLLTVDERDTLHALAAMLDQMPADEPSTSITIEKTATAQVGTVRPGDDYNTRADWDDILTGWTRTRDFGGGAHGWTRPGKNARDGISATTGTTRDGHDRLYVFSSSTPFDTEKPYSKFAAYTHLEHGGDWKTAAKALRGQGYGTPLEPSRPVDITDIIADEVASEPHNISTPGSTAEGSDGNLATVTHLRPKEAQNTLAHSDDGNALALIDAHGHHIRYCPDRGRWLHWTGTVWKWAPAGGGVVRELAKDVVRGLPDADPAAAKHKVRSLGAVGITAMLTQAATDRRVTVPLAHLDAHPWDLNTPAGIVDLRTGRLGPSDPRRLHTRITSCAPDFTASPAHWLRFLHDTFGDDQPLIDYLQRLVGYSAVGKVGPHVLPFCLGSGGNGKGVFLEAITKALGDYATTAPSGFLMARAHANHETEIARLAGARMVLCSEVNEGDRFDEAKVKQLTGGDTLTARFMRQDHFTFPATHHLWLMGNSQPEVRSGGRAFWRRLRLIPFHREVPDNKQVDDLQNILAGEHGPALLAWIAEGAALYASQGLLEPDSVKVATASYAHNQDTVARFLEDRCLLGGGEHVKTRVTDLRTAYEQWCHGEGETPLSARSLGVGLRSKYGLETRRDGRQRFYAGITLLGNDGDASPEGDASDGSWFG